MMMMMIMTVLVCCLLIGLTTSLVLTGSSGGAGGGGEVDKHTNNDIVDHNYRRHLSSFIEERLHINNDNNNNLHPPPQTIQQKNEKNENNEEGKVVEEENIIFSSNKSPPPPKLRLNDDDIEIISHFGSGSINVVFECRIINEEWWKYQNSLPPERSRKYDKHTTRFLLKVTNNIEYGRREYNAMNVMTEEIERSYRHNHNNHHNQYKTNNDVNGDDDDDGVVGLLPLLAGAYNVTSPFHTGELTLKHLDLTKESKYIRRYTDRTTNDDSNSYSRLVMLLVEDASQNMAGYVYDDGLIDTLPKVRTFMKSILTQMQHAWRVGVNNLDLSGNRNVYVDKDLKAILFDWNGWVDVGEPIFDPDYNFDLVPPEAWVQDMDGHTIKVTNETLHSFDVWSIGIMLARLLYAPNCKWSNGQSYQSRKQRLAQHILHLGIHKYDPHSDELPQFWVPVGGGGGGGDGGDDQGQGQVDMVKVAGLTKEQFQSIYDETIGKDSSTDAATGSKISSSIGQRYRTGGSGSGSKDGGIFYPTLAVKNRMSKVCYPSEQSFFVLDDPNVSVEEREIVVDFLRQMMTLEPAKRPNYDQLLQHPFFSISTSSSSSSLS